MFWGLILEPQRRYSQIVKRSFHISKASLDIFASTDKPCQVMLTSQNRNYLLCTLQKDAKLQCNLDLNFIEGEEVMFATNGGSNVHLTGYLMEDDMVSDEEECVTTEEEEFEEISAGKRKRQLVNDQPKKKTKTEQLLDEIDNEYNSEEDPTYPNIEDEDVESEEIEDDADEDEEDADDSDESMEDISNLSKEDIFMNGGTGKRQLRKATLSLLNKSKEDSEESDDEEEEEEEKPVKQKLQGKLNGISKNKKEKPSKGDKPAKQQKAPKESPKPEKVSQVQESKSPKKTRQIEGGVTIQDLKEGEGKVVKSGRIVQVYYEGRLKSNNKMFDSATKGNGFKFRVGKKEVIKGWDIGLVGMKVGGKRRIVCPPNMAYGAQGSGSVIPPNSTLIFDVEVKNVN